MATMGFLVLPFNILVSKLAKDMEDRTMMAYLNYLSFASVVFILHMPFLMSYSTTQYVFGSIMIFVFLNALEGTVKERHPFLPILCVLYYCNRLIYHLSV